MPEALQLALWFFGISLEVAIVILMLRRNLHRELPWFFAYMIFDASQSAFSWFLWGKPALYFYFYWAMEVVGVTLAFVIIYEVFSKIVERYERVRRVGFLLYRWLAVGLLFVATVVVAMERETGSNPYLEAIVTLQRGVRLVQSGLLVFLFAFTSYLALSWRSFSFGVMVGFGFLAIAELALAAIRAQVGPSATPLYSVARPIVYVFTVLIWTAYVLQRQPALKQVTTLPKTELSAWKETLTDLVRR